MLNVDLQFEIRYDYLPSNILHRLMISRYEELDAGKKWWYSGGVFKSDAYRCIALILQESKAGKDVISIYIRQNADGEAWRYLSEIRNHIKEAGRQLNIVSDSYIIYHDSESRKIEEISLDTILKSLKCGWTTYQSVVLGKEIPFQDILKSITIPDIAKAIVQNNLLNVIVAGCRRMQKRCSWLPKEENKRNDYLCDILRSAQIYVLDQTRSGLADSESGELDFVLQDNEFNDIAIIEALNLENVDKHYLKSHIDKLMSDKHYNVNGLRELYLLIYANVKHFDDFCKRYELFIAKEVVYPCKLKKEIEKVDQKLNNICVKKAVYENGIILHHICVKMVS